MYILKIQPSVLTTITKTRLHIRDFFIVLVKPEPMSPTQCSEFQHNVSEEKVGIYKKVGMGMGKIASKLEKKTLQIIMTVKKCKYFTVGDTT